MYDDPNGSIIGTEFYTLCDNEMLCSLQNRSDEGVGSRVLTALDRFALRAYDEREQPKLEINGLSELHIHCTRTKTCCSYPGLSSVTEFFSCCMFIVLHALSTRGPGTCRHVICTPFNSKISGNVVC